MSGEEDAAFSAGRKIFRPCYCVDEDSIADAGKGRLLLISAGMMKIPLSPLHGSDDALFLLLRGLFCCSAREGNLTKATPAEKLILQLSMAGEEGVIFSAGVVAVGAERKPAALAARINPLPFPEGLVLFLLQRVRVVMFKLCLWRKRVVAGVVWCQARKEESEDKVSSPMFCSCKPQTGEERKVAKGQ
ncbi:hypothetical protein POTOM_020353 [Populus tomentosa]|uniref:Uncharacterized protein n=1 Tax=Populus tomentosa TaxID=118781 RepID=A0A8X7ZNI1_POPTO|nr:hypothetical protein POTOM_020353 [Populus tomentosa]